MGNQIELRHIRYFLAVAEDLHFRKAAERLYISQPGLSRQIKIMERDLGIILFERHNRKVALTEVGKYLQKELTNNLKNLEQIFDHAQLIEKGDFGSLKLGYVGSAMRDIIPNLLLQLRNSYPDVVFGLNEMDNNRQINELLSHEIDLGFVRLERVPRGLEIQSILKEPFCLVLPESHAISVSNFKHLNQFKDEHFILFDQKYSTSYYEKVMQIFDDSGFTPLVSHNTIHATSIYNLVKNNFGISLVPKSLISTSEKGIKFIELNKISQRTVLSVVWNKKNKNPMLEIFLKMINS